MALHHNNQYLGVHCGDDMVRVATGVCSTQEAAIDLIEEVVDALIQGSDGRLRVGKPRAVDENGGWVGKCVVSIG